MDKFVDVIEKISDLLDRLVGWSCVILGSAMTVVVCVAVMFRYVLNAPLEWSEEISTFMMVWFAMLGASMGVYRGRHVGVSFVIEKVGFLSRNYRAVSIVSNLLILGFLMVLLWQGYILAMFARLQQSPALMISMFWPYFGLLVGAVAVSLQVVFQIIKAGAGRDIFAKDACCYQGEET